MARRGGQARQELGVRRGRRGDTTQPLKQLPEREGAPMWGAAAGTPALSGAAGQISRSHVHSEPRGPPGHQYHRDSRASWAAAACVATVPRLFRK